MIILYIIYIPYLQNYLSICYLIFYLITTNRDCVTTLYPPLIKKTLIPPLSCTTDRSFRVVHSPRFWFYITILLSTPYAIYIIVWTQSDAFISLIKQLQLGVSPIDLFAYLVYAIKLLQLIVLTLYFFAIGFMWKFSPIRTVMGTIIFAFGQFFNASTYHTIGYNGVHYGCRLNREKPIPWVYGFPFNVVSHPQYVGSVLSIWGILLVVWNLRLGFAPVWMACMWTWYYVVVSKVESLL